MVLSERRVKQLAERARSLPDAILADLALGVLLGTDATETPVEATARGSATSQARDADDQIQTRQHYDGQTHQRLVHVVRRGPKTTATEQPSGSTVQRLVAFVRANPGSQRSVVVAALSITIDAYHKAMRKAIEQRSIERRGERRLARLWPLPVAA